MQGAVIGPVASHKTKVEYDEKIKELTKTQDFHK